ncbi:hypothetical protein WM16_03530 [Burkholderia ubonensis]|uniref:Uncharacterized protein n=1 Tax=Burkholderia ubonensis TaxID=101571 RepID=A0A108D1G9_9BURK|nr:hypothetical protein WM16_03530 [Burkholderia ubonensis]
MKKLPEITLAFWIMKICATTLGETGSDLLTKPVAKGGLALGTVGSSAVLLGVLVATVAYATFAAARRPAPGMARIGRPAQE